MKKALIICSLALAIYACGGGEEKKEAESGGSTAREEMFKEAEAPKTGDDSKGIGKFTDVPLDPKLDEKMAAVGQGVFDLKCSSCHKLTDERVVGPGWAGVTTRRKPEWIMNFITNVDEMLNKDAESQAMLEVCLVRMPNQNLSDEDARAVLEFMRKNDGVK
jgi:hypothetical protein